MGFITICHVCSLFISLFILLVWFSRQSNNSNDSMQTYFIFFYLNIFASKVEFSYLLIWERCSYGGTSRCWKCLVPYILIGEYIKSQIHAIYPGSHSLWDCIFFLEMVAFENIRIFQPIANDTPELGLNKK